MRAMLMLLAVAGCAGDVATDAQLHMLVTCDGSWRNSVAMCEAACESCPGTGACVDTAGTVGAGGDVCTAKIDSANDGSFFGSDTIQCQSTFDFDGHAGCCAIAEIRGGPIVFAECE